MSHLRTSLKNSKHLPFIGASALYIAICIGFQQTAGLNRLFAFIPLVVWAIVSQYTATSSWEHRDCMMSHTGLMKLLGAFFCWSLVAACYIPFSFGIIGLISALGLLALLIYGIQATHFTDTSDKSSWYATVTLICFLALGWTAGAFAYGGGLSNLLTMAWMMPLSLTLYIPVIALRLLIGLGIWRMFVGELPHNGNRQLVLASIVFGLLHAPEWPLVLASSVSMCLTLSLYRHLRRWGPALMVGALFDMVTLLLYNFMVINIIWGSLWATPPH